MSKGKAVIKMANSLEQSVDGSEKWAGNDRDAFGNPLNGENVDAYLAKLARQPVKTLKGGRPVAGAEQAQAGNK